MNCLKMKYTPQGRRLRASRVALPSVAFPSDSAVRSIPNTPPMRMLLWLDHDAAPDTGAVTALPKVLRS